MEHTSKTSPKDFFLWFGAILALYGSISFLITLLFEYINYSFPDPLASYADPYSGTVRFAMAALIVLVPTMLVLFRIIRGTIISEPGKQDIWVRRWALMLTIFIATASILIDLITVLNTFLSGEITERFFLKTVVVFLIALGVFLHFLADFKGYWATYPKKANLVGIATGILALVVIVAGFFIVGSPSSARDIRFDMQKVSDLQSIQYQVLNYWQMKEALPQDLDVLADPLSGNIVPVDTEINEPYTYSVTGALSFKLCATFNQESPDTAGRGEFLGRDVAYPSMMGGGVDENWQHGVGETCFDRTIDPERYPPFEKPLR